jgi:hypothetical protein
LYRTKSILDLPERRDEVYRLQFSPEENEVYQKIKLQTAEIAAAALSSKERGTLSNALSKLNQLRLTCNHGLMQSKKPIAHSSKGSWSSTKAQSVIEEMLENGNAFCSLCDTNIAEVTPEDLDAGSTELPQPNLFSCRQLICGVCLSEGIRDNQCPACPPDRKCTGFEVALTPTPLSTQVTPSQLPEMSISEVPTKIRALLASLERDQPGDKRYIGFVCLV